MNGEDKKFLGELITSQARMEEKIDNIHDDVKELKRWNTRQQKELANVISNTKLNTRWIERHQKEHDGYFARVIAIIGMVTGMMTFGWKIIVDTILK